MKREVKMLREKNWLLFLMAIVGMVLLAACGSTSSSDDDGGDKEEAAEAAESAVNETGMPIVDEEIDMEIFANKPASHENNDWNDILVWNHYKDLTNVNVNWNQIPYEALEEKRNRALGSNDLPDAYFLSELSNSDLLKYWEQGNFLKLNDLIEKYAPNLTALMEKDPSIRRAITYPDGNIYSMPALIEEDFLSLRLSARP